MNTTINSKHEAFTLVELLVVIGIIGLLVAILLPTLSGARKSAASTKCLAHLRQIGQAYMLYSNDNKGWWPIAAWRPLPTGTAGWRRESDNTIITAYWYNFLGKYLTKTKLGIEAVTAQELAQAQGTVLWGCPAWDGRTTTGANGLGGIDRFQTGYAMQQEPTMEPDYPTPSKPSSTGSTFATPDKDKAIIRGDYSPALIGRFFKQTEWSKPAQRILVADSLYWILEVSNPPGGVIPNSYTLNAPTYPNATFDFYRHGKYPRIVSGTQFDGSPGGGGKVAFNALFCDGSAKTLLDRKDGYRGVRMKFPG